MKSFPYNAWRKLSKESLVADRAELFRLGKFPRGMGTSKSDFQLSVSGHGESSVTPEQIIVGAGNDYLLMLLCMILGSGL